MGKAPCPLPWHEILGTQNLEPDNHYPFMGLGLDRS